MRKLGILIIAAIIASLFILTGASAEDSIFTKTEGFAVKTGFRFVFAWEASEPVWPTVQFGTSPDALTESAVPFPAGGTPDTAGLVVADRRDLMGETIYWRFVDDLTGETSEISSFKAANAYNAWDPVEGKYTLNVLVQVDTNSPPSDVPADLSNEDTAAGMNIFAERLYDAMDGYAKLGKVLVTDTNLEYSGNLPGSPPPPCAPGSTNVADVIVTSTPPFDSHTWGGWSIDDPCISFYVGRAGQLVVPWQSDLHLGYISTHEMMHYAFNAPDLYDLANLSQSAPEPGDNQPWCKNLEWDGSLMNNQGGWENGRWELTELDRNATTTPCDHEGEPYTWDVLRDRYRNVPASPASGPVGTGIDSMFDIAPRGNPDGGSLDIDILDRQPGTSSLQSFTPNDGEVLCGNKLPQIVDAQGDGTSLVYEGTYLPNEPSLDVLSGFLTWDAAAQTVKFHVIVDDLTDLPPVGAAGHFFRFYFDYEGRRYQVTASRDAAGQTSFGLRLADNTTIRSGLTGSFNAATDEIVINLKAADFNSTTASRFEPDPAPLAQESRLEDFEILAQRSMSAAVLVTDVAGGHCAYDVGQESRGPNTPPVAEDDSVSTPEDASVTVTVVANDTDADGDSVRVTAVTPASSGLVSIVSGGQAVTYSPNAHFNGTDSFMYSIKDGKGGTASAKVNVTVTPVADPPRAMDDRAVTLVGKEVIIPVRSNDSDPDGDPIHITDISSPTTGTATAGPGGTIKYTPSPSAGPLVDRFEYTLSDGSSTDTATVSVRVLPEGTGLPCELPGTRLLTDPTDDTTVVGLAKGPSHDIQALYAAGKFDSSRPGLEDQLVFTIKVAGPLNPPPAESMWRVAFTVGAAQYYVEMLTDPSGAVTYEYGTIATTFTPVGSADSGSFTPEGLIQIGIATSKIGSPAAGSNLTAVRAVTGPIVNGVVFESRPTSDSTSAATYEVESCAGPAVNLAPNAIDDSATTSEDSAVTVAVLSNDSDPDGDALKVSELGTVSNGTAVINPDGTITYTPNPNFSGVGKFVYSVTDGDLTSSAEVSVEVTPVNDAPVALDDQASSPKGGAVTVRVLSNDVDVDGDALKVTGVSAPTNGTATVNDDGSITYVPRNGFKGNDSFTYSISDGHGGTDTATVSISVGKR